MNIYRKLCALSGILLFGCSLPEVGEQRLVPPELPQACFSLDPNPCTLPGCEITFDASCSLRAVEYVWDFDINSTDDPPGEDASRVSFTYTQPGTYTVELVVRNADGDSHTTTREVTINPAPFDACFNVDKMNCEVADCTVSFNAACSAGAAVYKWDFDEDGDFDIEGSNEIQVTHQFTEVGNFTVKLEIEDGSGNTDTEFKTITVSPDAIVRFELPIDLGPINVTPYRATERSTLDYHLLYSQNGLKTAIVNTSGAVVGTPKDIAINVSVNHTLDHDGGFLISGQSGNSAGVAFVDELQTKPLEEKLNFDGANSWGQGVLVNAGNEIVLTGLGSIGNTISPGLGRMGFSGSIIRDDLVTAAIISGYEGISLVERTDGNLFIACNYALNPGVENAILVNVTQTGNYNSNKSIAPIVIARKVVRTTGSNYAVLGTNGSGMVVILGIDGDGNISWQRDLSVSHINDMIYDGALVICGTKSGDMYWARFPAADPVGDNASNSWSHTARGANGAIQGLTISKTDDEGYLLLGIYDNSGKNEAFLVKTDPEGKSKP